MNKYHHHHHVLVLINRGRYIRFHLVRSKTILSVTLSALRAYLTAFIQVFLYLPLSLEVFIPSKLSFFHTVAFVWASFASPPT